MGKRDPRGFRYALEPLRQKCDWELQDARLTVSRLNGEIEALLGHIAELENALDEALTELAAQHGASRVIHIDRQRIAMGYLASLRPQIKAKRTELAALEAERDGAIRELHRLQKFADGLDEHRDDAVTEYAKGLGAAAIVDADEAWLRAAHWRRTQ